MGNKAKTVTLVSAEGFEYVVRRDCLRRREHVPPPFAVIFSRKKRSQKEPFERLPTTQDQISYPRFTARGPSLAASDSSAQGSHMHPPPPKRTSFFSTQVDYEAACVSNMIKNLMTSAGGFSELESNKIKFPEIRGPILEKVCQYFYYKLRHTNNKDTLPQFPLPPEMALELLMAANFLDV